MTEFWSIFLSLFSPLFWGGFTGVSILLACFFVPYFMTDFRGVFSCLVLVVLQFDGSLLVLDLVFQGLGGLMSDLVVAFCISVGPISWSVLSLCCFGVCLDGLDVVFLFCLLDAGDRWISGFGGLVGF